MFCRKSRGARWMVPQQAWWIRRQQTLRNTRPLGDLNRNPLIGCLVQLHQCCPRLFCHHHRWRHLAKLSVGSWRQALELEKMKEIKLFMRDKVQIYSKTVKSTLIEKPLRLTDGLSA